jgi:hypothetical protein
MIHTCKIPSSQNKALCKSWADSSVIGYSCAIINGFVIFVMKPTDDLTKFS